MSWMVSERRHFHQSSSSSHTPHRAHTTVLIFITSSSSPSIHRPSFHYTPGHIAAASPPRSPGLVPLPSLPEAASLRRHPRLGLRATHARRAPAPPLPTAAEQHGEAREEQRDHGGEHAPDGGVEAGGGAGGAAVDLVPDDAPGHEVGDHDDERDEPGEGGEGGGEEGADDGAAEGGEEGEEGEAAGDGVEDLHAGEGVGGVLGGRAVGGRGEGFEEGEGLVADGDLRAGGVGLSGWSSAARRWGMRGMGGEGRHTPECSSQRCRRRRRRYSRARP